MSEYQYYEFLAIDRPLNGLEQAEVRSLSTRARITATSFVNEYHWGDFKGDPSQLMRRYYDAHLYLANWGTHQVMFRLPLEVLDPALVEDYCIDEYVSAWVTDEFLVLEFISEDDAGEFDFDDDPGSLLSGIVGVRGELAAGDLRGLYLAWFAAHSRQEPDEQLDPDELEPPVPAGLGALSAPQRALADFLYLDNDLLASAAETSPPLQQVTEDPGVLAGWVARLPVTDKDQLLARVVQGQAAQVHRQLLRRFRDETTTTISAPVRRAVAELLDAAAQRRVDHQRRQQPRIVARERQLDKLAGDQDAAWSRIEAMISTPECRGVFGQCP